MIPLSLGEQDRQEGFAAEFDGVCRRGEHLYEEFGCSSHGVDGSGGASYVNGINVPWTAPAINNVLDMMMRFHY